MVASNLIPPHTGSAPIAISPTDVSQFIRLDQCQRYLRLRLQERTSGAGFLRAIDVAPQSIPPILTRSGAQFEQEVAAGIGQRYPMTVFSAEERVAQGTTSDNDAVVAAATSLLSGQVTVLLQPRLETTLGAWNLRGDVDLLRLERTDAGGLRVLIADMKSSTAAKVEHRLQVAFYHDMLQNIFKEAGVPHQPIDLGILYRGSLAAVEDDEAMQASRALARDLLGTEAGYLELVDDVQPYVNAVEDLVLGPGSLADRLLRTEFDEIPFHLTYKCDGCLYNEFCLKVAANTDDLSLIPHLSDSEKSVLRTRGVTTTSQLANLKEIHRGGTAAVDGVQQEVIDLVPTAGNDVLARELATTWPVGPRLDELVHRARRYQSRFGARDIEAIGYIPHKGYGTMPACDAELHPNLVKIFVDVQHDYLQDRVYLLGALVVGHEHGEESAERRRSVVRMAGAPPESDEAEAELLREWIAAVLQAVIEVAAPDDHGDPRAPIHLVFFNEFAQRTLLDACSRHARTILGATAVYDLVTQLAAYESPVATLLEDQIREQKNYPMLCQSLQSVATFLKFDWNAGVPYREIFRERLFDYIGRMPDEDTGDLEWYTRRSRFNSQLPLEYAYAAWGNLPVPEPGAHDEFEPFRPITSELVTSFHARRLEAIEHVARDFRGNRQTSLVPFDLATLAEFSDKAPTLAHALDEFVMIERHVELAAWKRDRLAPPELRMLRGQSLVVQYVEEDQPPEIVAEAREAHRRYQEAEALKAASPDGKLTKAQREATKWTQTGRQMRLRIRVPDDTADLADVLRLLDLKAGDGLVIAPRHSVDTRLPEADQVPFTSTPRQLVRAPRARLIGTETEPDGNGGIARAWAIVEMAGPGFGNKYMGGFAFQGWDEPLAADTTYSLDEDPNDINGYRASKVTQGLQAGGSNRLYDLLTGVGGGDVVHPAAFIDGQHRFLEGLDALAGIDSRYAFEMAKRRFIGEHAADPILLVQGPPGTGKSYSTAFALLARLQGAMAADVPFRIVISCKTHAAIDVLLDNVNETIGMLRRVRDQHPDLCRRYFDARLLDLPLCRIRPKGSVHPGITSIVRDKDRPKGEPKAVERLLAERWAVIAATPGAIYTLVADQWDSKRLFGHELIQCVVLDEASQMDLPNAIMAALPLSADGQLIVVGDHRQMPPIVRNDWDNEPRRTFKDFQAYRSLFETLLSLDPPVVRFEESFRLHSDMAEFLRREIYVKDGINYHSNRHDRLALTGTGDSFVKAVLDPAHPLIVIVHDETTSQLQNQFELSLMRPILAELTDPAGLNLDADNGFGVVVPHRAQRAAITDQIADVTFRNPDTGEIEVIAVDTVERYQGDERLVMVYSATESDHDYLLRSSRFLMDPRRLNVALSRAKRKLIVIAARSVFNLFSADEETFQHAQLWKNLLRTTCVMPLWEGERHGHQVEVWGNPATGPFPPIDTTM